MAEPPYYILFSHSTLSTAVPGPQSTSFNHPVIQYHYADDSPLALLPCSPNEHVLVFDYDPSASTQPSISSLSKDMVVTGLKIAEAPGAAAAAAEDDQKRNDRMYILETTTTSEDKPALDGSRGGRVDGHAVLTQYKQRNAILRRALLYPATSKITAEQNSPAIASLPSSSRPQSQLS